jgi:FKBP-type peptidyl-prolyl cis-trans isomerase FkpA
MFPMRTILTFLAVILLAGCSTSQRTLPGEQTTMEKKFLPSGLSYIEITPGTGEQARAGQQVTVHYTGYLTNGKKFDSSVDRGKPYTFALGAGRVIKGWEEGIEGMKVGEKRKLIIPPNLGYGSRGAGEAIPPNAELVFDVELLKVE